VVHASEGLLVHASNALGPVEVVALAQRIHGLQGADGLGTLLREASGVAVDCLLQPRGAAELHQGLRFNRMFNARNFVLLVLLPLLLLRLLGHHLFRLLLRRHGCDGGLRR